MMRYRVFIKERISSMKKIAFFILILIITVSVLYRQLKNNTESGTFNLITNWRLTGDKSQAMKSNLNVSSSLKGKNILQVTYNLHGLCLLGGGASAIILDQGSIQSNVSLSQYGKNCYDGEQTAYISLEDFIGLDTNRKLEKVTASFWYPTYYSIDIKNAAALRAASNVLGESVRPDYTKYHKTFPNITPIRSFPYAAK